MLPPLAIDCRNLLGDEWIVTRGKKLWKAEARQSIEPFILRPLVGIGFKKMIPHLRSS
jgi:hypothetical protein